MTDATRARRLLAVAGTAVAVVLASSEVGTAARKAGPSPSASSSPTTKPGQRIGQQCPKGTRGEHGRCVRDKAPGRARRVTPSPAPSATPEPTPAPTATPEPTPEPTATPAG